MLWWYEPIYVHRTCLPGKLPWVKELLRSKDDIAPLLPPTLEHPLVPLLTRCQRRHGHLHPAELRTMELQRWLEAVTVTVPPTLTCRHANSVEAARVTLRSRSVIVLAIIFQSSWQKCIWLCKIQDINKLARKSWLCSFLLPLSQAHIFWGQRRSDTKWTWHRQKTHYAMNAKVLS